MKATPMFLLAALMLATACGDDGRPAPTPTAQVVTLTSTPAPSPTLTRTATATATPTPVAPLAPQNVREAIHLDL